ncbi:MAG: ABC transporter permease [Acidimicrobiales bacterium]
MIGYIVRRVFQSVLVIIGVLVITYVLYQLLGPQALARSVLQTSKATQAQLNQVIREYGYNLPFYDQLWQEVVNYLHGNFGRSPGTNQFVLTQIGVALPRSLVLVGLSLLVAIFTALPLGVFQTVRRNKPSDYVFTGLAFTFYALPDFVLGVVLLLLFEDHYHVFTPISQSESPWQIAANWRQITLPVLTLSATSVAAFSRYARSSMMDAISEDYVRTAVSKGAGQLRVLFRHAFRNALIPIITLIGLSLPAIAGGAVITEVVFNYPGMGLLAVQGADNNDVQLVVGTTIVATVLTVIGSLLADVLYAVVDPRIRYGRH